MNNHQYDFTRNTDEELCTLAQRGSVSARNTLWERCREHIDHTFNFALRNTRLGADDRMDLQEELFFSFQKSVEKYDLQHRSNDGQACFKTFLTIVIKSHVLDFLKKYNVRQRAISFDFAEAEENDSLPSELFIDEEATNSSTRFDGGRETEIDWKSFLLFDMTSEKLAACLSKLKKAEQCLIAAWLHGGSDRNAAKELRISEKALKQRRERLFRRIAENYNAD